MCLKNKHISDILPAKSLKSRMKVFLMRYLNGSGEACQLEMYVTATFDVNRCYLPGLTFPSCLLWLGLCLFVCLFCSLVVVVVGFCVRVCVCVCVCVRACVSECVIVTASISV